MCKERRLMMNSTQYLKTLLLTLALIVTPAILQAQDVDHGRISFAGEDGLIKGPQDDDWSYVGLNSIVTPGDTIWADEEGVLEVEFTGGNFLRLADGSRLDVVSAPPRTLLRGWTGSFYLQRTPAGSGELIFETPVSRVSVDPDSQVRVDILDDGTTTVSVRWGRARVDSDAGTPVNLTAGQRTFVDPGYQPSVPIAFDRSLQDAFDEWNRVRARNIALGGQNIPIAAASNVDAPIGYSDLNDYGEWVYVDKQTYWKPAVVDYVPYRSGHWSYVPVQGHVWVGDYPFAYVTSHHGHWNYHDRHGWLWGYTRAYSPAYVFSVRLGDSFIWSPIDVHGYPVHHGSDSFYVGGIGFSVGFSSFSLSVNLLGGHHHSYALHNHHINHYGHHYNHNYHYWNIHSPKSHYRSHARHDFDSNHVRRHTPDRVLRGGARHALRADHASTRVARLQSRTGREHFRTSTPSTKRSARTVVAANGRHTRTRDVRIQPDAMKRTSRNIAASTRGARTTSRTGTVNRTRGMHTTRTDLRGNSTNRVQSPGDIRRQQGVPTQRRTDRSAGISTRAAGRPSPDAQRPRNVTNTRRTVSTRDAGYGRSVSSTNSRGTAPRTSRSPSTPTRPNAVGNRGPTTRSSGGRTVSPPTTRRDPRTPSFSRPPASRAPVARSTPQSRSNVNRSTRVPANRNFAPQSQPSRQRSTAPQRVTTNRRPAPSTTYRAPSSGRSSPSASSRSSSSVSRGTSPSRAPSRSSGSGGGRSSSSTRSHGRP